MPRIVMGLAQGWTDRQLAKGLQLSGMCELVENPQFILDLPSLGTMSFIVALLVLSRALKGKGLGSSSILIRVWYSLFTWQQRIS